VISSPEQLKASHIPFPYIQKLRRDGYDGKGVYKVIDQSYLANAFTEPSLLSALLILKKKLA
jgi:5-(carboxyamino)imidazole ribonucleotide synthase